MSGVLLVEEPGLSTTVQDFGRMGYQHLGVPVSGAFDRLSLMAANLIVGNALDTAALECLYLGPVLTVAAESVRVAVAGSGASLQISPPSRSPFVLPALQSATVPRGAHIRVVFKGPSISCYLAVAGGIAVPRVMGSRSTYARARIGGVDGRALVGKDILPLACNQAPAGPEMTLPGVRLEPCSIVRVVTGPQTRCFSRNAQTALESRYIVSGASDRMGIRLSGNKLEQYDNVTLSPEGIPAGAVQVPGDGLPIILHADRQTTGGYAKIAHVISADLWSLGRVGPGQELEFKSVTMEQARTARQLRDAEVRDWPRLLAPLDHDEPTDMRLHAFNLISGVVDGLSEGAAGSHSC